MTAPHTHGTVLGALTRALNASDSEHWLEFKARLLEETTEAQRAGMAFAALRSLPSDLAEDVCIRAMNVGHVGTPIPPFMSVMDEASFWADMADQEELEAYCLVCFNRMPLKRRSDFLEFVQGRAVA